MNSSALSKGGNFSVQADTFLHWKTGSKAGSASRKIIQFNCILLIKLWIYVLEDAVIRLTEFVQYFMNIDFI